VWKTKKCYQILLYSISISVLLFNVAFLFFGILKQLNINYIWYLVIFIILSLIQIFFINKGCIRITRVAARFSLDSLPGNEKAID